MSISVSSSPAQQASKALLKQLPPLKRGVGNLVRLEESDHGLAHITVLQDMSTALLPRLLVARTGLEMAEGTFLELFENVLIYYSIPFLGSKGFKPLIRKLVPDIDAKHLSQPLSEIPEHLHAKVVPAKAALILGALGMAIAGEYAVNYAKPLLTAKLTGKTDFSDIVGLEKTDNQSHQADPAFVHKMRNRFKLSMAAMGTLLLGSLALAKFGHNLPGGGKALSTFVKKMDFSHNGNGGMSLGRNQMIAYMGLAVPGYLDACRDNLERVEVGTRLALILPYLIFFKSIMEKHLAQHLAKKTPEAFQQKSGQFVPKKLEEIHADALKAAQKALPKATETEVAQHAAEIAKKAVNARLKTFAIPVGVGIVGAGIGVSLLNQFWTRYRYAHQRSYGHQHVGTQCSVNNPFQKAVVA